MTEKSGMVKNSVVLVPFPFDEFDAVKVRPALCLTNEIGSLDHVIIAFISSKIPQEFLKSDLILSQKIQGFKKTGLMKDSVIRLHNLVTIPKSLIRRKLGVISPATHSQIKEKLLNMFEY